mgnify:CR=1 FL=1
MGKRGRPPILPFGEIGRRGYIVAPPDLAEHAVRNAASLWGRTYGVRIYVHKVQVEAGTELRLSRAKPAGWRW